MSGDLKWNKIFGAGLATVFAIVVVNQVSGFVYSSEPPEKMGYFIDAPEEAAGGEAEVELPPDWGTVLPVADVAAGERAFARCAACHTINQGGANGIGPNLYGVVGGPITHAAGFDYSPALREHAAANPTWTYDELDQFITAPSRHVRGTKMSFAGIRNTEERVALIAYLRSQGSGGYAIPAPDPSRQPGAEGEAAAEEIPPLPEGAADEGIAQTPNEGVAATADFRETSPAQPSSESEDQN
ncbi:MAG: cytochrome c family protein [Brevundimonas sp.]